METHELVQGSDAWQQFRLTHFGASEAAAMLGISPKVKRTELLRAKKTGVAKEFGEWLQRNVLDYGHEVEALARPHIEALIGEDLYPVTMSDGSISASCDGLTMDDRLAMEHKQINATYGPMVAAGQVPEEHMPQCQQVLMVTGAEKLIFVMSDGTAENMVYCWVLPDPVWFQRLRAGWAQFAVDLAAFDPTATAPAPVVAAVTESLPSVSVIVTGEITIKDNFKAFEVALKDFLEHRLIREPKSDQDFADLDVQIKAMKGAEAALDSAEAGWIAQIDPISAATRTKKMLATLVRENRLMAERLLKDEKERRRVEIVTAGTTGLQQHIAALNTRLGRPYMPATTADFGMAIKGMRSLASMEDAVATTLANAKIATNEIADRIQANLGMLRDQAGDYKALFADTAQLVLKATDDLQAVITSRIAEQKASDEKRLAADRVRIAAEEREKAEADAAKKLREEAAAQAAREARERAEAAAAAPAVPAAVAAPAPAPAAAPAAPAPAVVPMVRPAPRAAAPMSAPTLKIGTINERIAPLSISAAGLSALGFEPSGRIGAHGVYHENQLPHMLAAMVGHLEAINAAQAA